MLKDNSAYKNNLAFATILIAFTLMFITVPSVVYALGTSGCGGCGGGGDYGGGSDYGGAGDGPDHGDGGGQWQNPAPVQPVVTYPKPSCTLSATEANITEGSSTILRLRTSNSVLANINRSVGSVALHSDTSVSPNKSKTYIATVTGAGGDTATCRTTVRVTAAPKQPSCTLNASPNSIPYDDSTTLSWWSNNASSASISHGIGTVGLSGTYGMSNLTNTKTYTLTVTGAGGTATCSTTVSVAQAPALTHPTCDVRVSRSRVDKGGQTTLYWTSTHATSLYITGVGYVTSNTNDSRIFDNIRADRTFTCTARNDAGDTDTDTALVRIKDIQYNNPPTCSIFASPISIPVGGDSTLTWSTNRATSVTLTGVGSVSLNGSRTVYNLGNSITYTLRATGPGGSTTCVRTISTYTPYQPPIVPPTKVRPTCQIYPVYVNPNTTQQGGGAVLSWTAQNAASATLTDHGTVNRVSGTQFVKPYESKTYTLTVFNDGYRASCSTYLAVAKQTITHYTPSKSVTLVNVPYTGAEDYFYLLLLAVLVLTIGFGIFTQRHRVFSY